MSESPRPTHEAADPIQERISKDYEWGFVTEIEEDKIPKGLNEDVVRAISARKHEPEWLLEWRLRSFRAWVQMAEEEPTWANIKHPKIDFQDIHYYSAPKKSGDRPKSLDEVDPEIRRTFDKLGIPLVEQMRLAGVAVDAVFDSVSVATTFKEKLAALGVIFCSFSEAVENHPELVRRALGTVVPYNDNFYAALNSAVFSDGSFVYVPSRPWPQPRRQPPRRPSGQPCRNWHFWSGRGKGRGRSSWARTWSSR